ncbi:MAG TPA: DUF4097 family beta strand repeat-containing protein [Streptosporangiaceae bacterium]|nr:DUF4097 family beta strand repeat-containing protein [Streptosporangiaceae bacterium]
MGTWEYPSSAPVDVNVEITAGAITVTGAETDTIKVRAEPGRPGGSALLADLPFPVDLGQRDPAGDLRVDFTDGRLVITEPELGGLRLRRGGLGLLITVPAGSRCTVRAVAADLDCQGELGALDVRTSSGSVSAAAVHGPVQVNTMSGTIRVDEAGGPVAVHTASGRIQIGHAADDVSATTASGGIRIGTADASVSAKTAVGKVRLGSVARGQATVTTASGDITVGVARGTGVYLDLSSTTGRVTSDLEPSEDGGAAELHLTCRSVTGTLHVARAEHAEVAS